MDSTSVHTCLIHGGPLSDPSAAEHAPPRALGGRLQPETSVCEECNNRAGHSIDAALIQSWAFVTIELQPLLSAAHQSKNSIRVSQGDIQFSFGPGGLLKRLTAIVKKNDRDEISLLSHHDERFLRKQSRRHPELAGKPIRAHVPRMDSDVVDCSRVAWSYEAEVGALKTALVVLDWAEQTLGGAWCRHPSTARSRRLIARALEDSEPDLPAARQIFLGINPLIAATIREVASIARIKLGQPEQSEFAHIFVFAGSRASGQLTATWLAFGYEPVSFLLSSQFDGPAFTWVVGTDPLKGGTTWGPVEVAVEFSPGRAHACSIVSRHQGASDVEVDIAMRLRMDIAARAAVAAMRSTPDYLPTICRNAVLHYVSKHKRTEVYFADIILEQLSTAWGVASVQTALTEVQAHAPSTGATRTIDTDLGMHEIPPWVQDYMDLFQRVLSWLADERGPGTRFLNSSITVVRELDQD